MNSNNYFNKTSLNGLLNIQIEANFFMKKRIEELKEKSFQKSGNKSATEMPKNIDKYVIERTKPIIIDESKNRYNSVEHYEAKEKETNKNFVLKRVKCPNDNHSSTTSLHSITQSPKGTFEQLTNETLILKLLDNNAIPKCLRMLKTSNSIYFIYEHYPFISLEEYLMKNDLNFETKKEISIKLIKVVDYIHKQAVIYRGINGKNIKIDGQLNIYLTNFLNARSYQNIDQKLKSLNEAKKEREYRSLINEDLHDLTKLLLKIFNLDGIDVKSSSFFKEKERKLYDTLSQCSEKKINFITLENLVNILTEKETLKTKACTSTTSSFHSIKIKEPRKSEKFKISREIPPLSQNFSKSFSSTNLTLRTSKNKENILTSIQDSRHIEMKKNKPYSISSTSNLLKSERLSWSDQLNSVVEKLEKEKEKERESVRKQISAINTTRKIINLILHCMKSLNKQSGINLVFLLAIKCEILAMREQREGERCLLQSIDNDQREALKQIKKENIKTIITLQIVKESIKELLTKYPSLEEENKSDLLELLKNEKICEQKIEEKLSSEIYSYLEKEALPIMQNYQEKTEEIIKKVTLQENGSELYEKFRQFYYLSIKLKYQSFEEFFEKKDNFQTGQFSILRDEYFVYFEGGKIPLHKIINEIKFRLETFGKKMNRAFSNASI